jgi:hypothetical protein
MASLPRKGLPPLEILAQGTGIPILLSNEAFCPDEEFLINLSAKSLITWRSMAVLENFRKNPADPADCS